LRLHALNPVTLVLLCWIPLEKLNWLLGLDSCGLAKPANGSYTVGSDCVITFGCILTIYKHTLYWRGEEMLLHTSGMWT